MTPITGLAFPPPTPRELLEMRGQLTEVVRTALEASGRTDQVTIYGGVTNGYSFDRVLVTNCRSEWALDARGVEPAEKAAAEALAVAAVAAWRLGRLPEFLAGLRPLRRLPAKADRDPLFVEMWPLHARRAALSPTERERYAELCGLLGCEFRITG